MTMPVGNRSSRGRRARVGVISDTHGLLREDAIAALRDSDHIVHAGDVGSEDILDRLRDLAPVTAVRGNVDNATWARTLPRTNVVEVAGAAFYVIHDVADLDLVPKASGFDAVVSGHSHRPGIEQRDGVIFLNPGSAGPRRFSLPVSVAVVDISHEGIVCRLVELPG